MLQGVHCNIGLDPHLHRSHCTQHGVCAGMCHRNITHHIGVRNVIVEGELKMTALVAVTTSCWSRANTLCLTHYVFLGVGNVIGVGDPDVSAVVAVMLSVCNMPYPDHHVDPTTPAEPATARRQHRGGHRTCVHPHHLHPRHLRRRQWARTSWMVQTFRLAAALICAPFSAEA